MSIAPEYIEGGLRRIFLTTKDHQKEEIQTYINTFAHKWGGWDYDNLLLAIEFGEERECAFAIGSLVQCDKQKGETLLTSLLYSDDPWRSWPSALSLGEITHREAFICLRDLLVKNLTLEHFRGSSYSNLDHFILNWRYEIPSLLTNYNDQSILPYIRRAIIQCEEIYNVANGKDLIRDDYYDSWKEAIEYYQLLLVYLAGKFNASGLIQGISHETEKALAWIIIQSVALPKQKFQLGRFWKFEDAREMHSAIHETLLSQFGLAEEEQHLAMRVVASYGLYHDFIYFQTQK